MRIKKLFIFFCLCFLTAEIPCLLSEESSVEHLVINNRILANINGKNISVFDVMKKMDVFLIRSYSEQENTPSFRAQFFISNWRSFLSQMIDHELILADAEKMEMKIPDATIRETIHERFGPSVTVTLDKLGITFQEAWQMIYSEIAVQRMSWYRVHSKALQKVGPQDIKIAFDEHLIKNPPKEVWKYQVLSIQTAAEKIGYLLAQKAHQLIQSASSCSFEELAERLKKENSLDAATTIQVSKDYEVEDKDLSSSHKSVLCQLIPNAYSAPTAQVSRTNKATIYRIFYLKDHIKNSPPRFDSMVDQLHDTLVQKEIEKEFPLYIKKLRQRFNVKDSAIQEISSDFQPFVFYY